MPEKTHSNPQVSIDHAEYQELLEAEKALGILTKAIDKGETKIIKVETDYHSKANYEKRDFYLVANPDAFTVLIMEKMDSLIKEVETMKDSYVGTRYGNASDGILQLVKDIHNSTVKPTK
jgi:hypothetical protein